MIKKKISNKSDPFEPISMCVREWEWVRERERETEIKKKERADIETQKLKHIWMRVKNKVYVCGGGWRAKYTCVEEKKIGKKKRKKRVWRKTRKEIKRKIK